MFFSSGVRFCSNMNKAVQAVYNSHSNGVRIQKHCRCLSTIKDGDKPFSRTFKKKQRQDWHRYSGQFRERGEEQNVPMITPYAYANMVQPSRTKDIGVTSSQGVSFGDKVTLKFSQEKLTSIPQNIESVELKPGSEVLSFVVGTEQVLPAFEDQVVGMQVGDKKRFMLGTENAYGAENPDAVMKVPLEKLHENAQAGDIVQIVNTNLEKEWEEMKNKFVEDDDKEWREHLDSLGDIPRAYATVAAVDESTGEATLNLNNPLAGYNLIFEIEVTELEPFSKRMESLPVDERDRKVEFSQQIESFLPEFDVAVPPFHLEVHYESLSFMFVGPPDVEKIKYPFEMNLDRFNL